MNTTTADAWHGTVAGRPEASRLLIPADGHGRPAAAAWPAGRRDRYR
jgi:hypothetical protein